MNMYTMSLVQDTKLGKGYIVMPKYMPKKWAGNSSQFNTQLKNDSQPSASHSVAANSSITESQKKELLNKLHAGQGDLSMEEWDDFLLDLTDMGLITNDQRLEAMGALVPLPDNVTSGSHWVTYEQKSDPYDTYCMDYWNGNPLDFLEKMDFYLHKQALNAKINHFGTTHFEQTRKTYSKISEIVKEILLS